MAETKVIFQAVSPSSLAICVREDEESRRDIWLPLSLIVVKAKLRDLERGDAVTIEAPEWMLEREGLA